MYLTFYFKVQPNCSSPLPASQDNPSKVITREEPINWPDIHHGTVEQHQQHLVKPAILAHPDLTKSFVSRTDSSELGLGCELFQLQEENLTAIGFGSSTLVGSKMK